MNSDKKKNDIFLSFFLLEKVKKNSITLLINFIFFE